MAISMLQQPLPQPPPYDHSTRTSTPRSFEDARSLALLNAGRDLSRPSTTTPVPSRSPSLSALPPQNSLHRQPSLQLPGLATLANIASSRSSVGGTPPPPPPRSFSMSYATTAPGLASGVGAAPPICQNCSTSTTPLWRRDEAGSVLCNACGLFLKLHGKPRPISLKTDVIKSRNRVKAPATNGQPGLPPVPKRKSTGSSLAAAHPDLSNPHLQHPHYQPALQQDPSLAPPFSQPHSRSATPSISFTAPNASETNIAPQHLFDNSTLDGTAVSPHTRHSNGATAAHDDLRRENADLKTRVSELEVINDLFRGRVTELEAAEAESRRRCDDLQRELDDTRSGLQHQNNSSKRTRQDHQDTQHDPKRPRIEEIGGDL